jgi:hypothetical protein
MSYWKRTSTWNKIKDSFSGVLAIGQLSLILNDSQHVYNVLCFIGQIAALLIPIWFDDKNQNDIADIFEKEVVTKVTSETPITVETKTENKTP